MERKVMFVYDRLSSGTESEFMKRGMRLLSGCLDRHGFSGDRKAYYLSESGKPPEISASEMPAGSVVAAMGAGALDAVSRRRFSFSDTRGCCLSLAHLPEDDPYRGISVFPMHSPSSVWANPNLEWTMEKDAERLSVISRGEVPSEPSVSVANIWKPEEVRDLHSMLLDFEASAPKNDRFLVVDCEWHGKNWMDPDRYIRSVQIGFSQGYAAVIEICRENDVFNHLDSLPSKRADRKSAIAEALRNPRYRLDDRTQLWAEIKSLLEDPAFKIAGQNIISDWEWLLSFGVDIRPRVVYDTMLAEHIINSDGPLRLDELAMKYTPYGRYSVSVDMWARDHKDITEHGYGGVPSSLLDPYAGYDVDCPRMIMREQVKELRRIGALDSRGNSVKYPSLFKSVMENELATDELERTGLPVDRERLSQLIDSYQGVRTRLLCEIQSAAACMGIPDFNPNSQQMVRSLLFGEDKLALPPVKATSGKGWGDAACNISVDSLENAPSASTDKSVLEILSAQNPGVPLVKKLLQFRRIDTVCKTWLRHPDENGEGGLESLIWPDGRLHSSFLPTTATMRYRCSSPNCFPGFVDVLTDRGWMKWSKAYDYQDTVSLAQWDAADPMRTITFSKPLKWYSEESPVVRFRCGGYIDVACTPDHRFEVYDAEGKGVTVRAINLPEMEGFSIPVSGAMPERPEHLRMSEKAISELTDCGSGTAVIKDGVLSEMEPCLTYCVTMPKGTVVVRYNGKVAFTRQCENFPKKAEGYLSEIFGEGKVPPTLRTIVKPPEGWIMMEGDFCQAELFTIANLSGDPEMLSALTTPGRDMHDSTALTSFGIAMIDTNGNVVPESRLVELAKEWGKDSKTFEEYMSAMRYRMSDGSVISRKAFKSGIRISAKAINFGIMYGRGGKAVAMQVKSETGTDSPLSELESQCERLVEGWKTRTFPTAWEFIESCQRAAYEPGYVENVWKFRKNGHTRPGIQRPDVERACGNFPIQSCVSGCTMLAMAAIRRYRSEHGMKFKIQNQIHDAIMLELPKEEMDECKKMFKQCMANIHVPLSGGREFVLDCDVDVYERWGVKLKQ